MIVGDGFEVYIIELMLDKDLLVIMINSIGLSKVKWVVCFEKLYDEEVLCLIDNLFSK